MDRILLSVLNDYETNAYDWKIISNEFNKKSQIHKTPRQCRERFNGYLNPKYNPIWTHEEETIAFNLFRSNLKPSEIAKRLKTKSRDMVFSRLSTIKKQENNFSAAIQTVKEEPSTNDNEVFNFLPEEFLQNDIEVFNFLPEEFLQNDGQDED